jgi:2',3'-cyclic-nucleotide 2'-phosphodiesterase (5'-nucleotidase family)
MSLSTTATNALSFAEAGRITLAGAEISAYDPASKRLFVTSNAGLQVVDLTTPAAPTLISTVDFTALGRPSTDASSVAVRNGVVAVTLIATDKTQPGEVALLSASTLALLGTVAVGANPDQLTFTPDGSKLLVANEGELNASGVDPVGSVSIIDVASSTVQTATFTAFNGQEGALRDQGVRIFAGKTVAEDVEPEYIAVNAAGTKAMVTLQEQNAVALLDIATATITAIVPLGTKDFSALLADFSDRDNATSSGPSTSLKTGQPVSGLFMPDAIASYTANGQTYYVIANEGDDRDDFLTPDETVRVGASGYDLDNAVFPNEASLKLAGSLGRLNVSNAPGLRGDSDLDNDVDQILTYGGRSFSILDANGQRVFDSADIIERIVATGQSGLVFDDTRSDNKGPEPEGITVGTIGGRTYAFVGLERAHGTLAFDVTDPQRVTYTAAAVKVGDLNPEGITFIPAVDSPNSANLLVVTNEVSNTATVFQVTPAVDYTLQLLHFSDGEAGLLASQTAPYLAALVDAFDQTYANTLILAGGDNWLPGPFLSAGTDPSVRGVLNAVTGSTITGTLPIGALDIAIHNKIGVEASTIGNHEFDLGSNVFRGTFTPGSGWVGANFPYLSANLDFSGDADLSSRFRANGVDGSSATAIGEASANKGFIVPSAVVTKGGEKIGLVAATTQLIEAISSPSGTEVAGFPGGPGANGETDNMALLAAQLQPIINELIGEGIDKIVLMSHLQVLANERALAQLLTGVDIILAAGSNTRLGDANDAAVAFPGHAATFADTYPVVTAGADGKPTLIVNTDNEYTYLGRLVVDFNAAGEIITANLPATSDINGAYAATEANVTAAWATQGGLMAAFADGTKAEEVQDLTQAVQTVISAKDGNVFGFTDVYLEGERIAVRNQETNFGNLTADANLGAAVAANAGSFVVSLKNGGGIRAQIGTISPPDPVTGSVTKLPPPANTAAGKPEGGVSQLDVENSLRFNNGLMAFDTTAAGLKAIIEHGVAVLGNQGRFPQIGGMRFSFDPLQPAGSRVTDLALVDGDGVLLQTLYLGGVLQAGVPATITMVTLNFLANGGDGYPMKANGSNFRFLLSDGTLSAPVDEALNFTAAGVVPANLLGEQQALDDYMGVNHATAATAFDFADVSQQFDGRIQNLSFRTSNVAGGLDQAFSPTDDIVLGTALADRIAGLGGLDRLFGAAGDDVLDGGTEGDWLEGGAGADTLIGGDGDDLAVYHSSASGVAINLATSSLSGGDAAGDTLQSVEGVSGSNFGDTVTGTDAFNNIFTWLGDDVVNGGGGVDVIITGGGSDVLIGGAGGDWLQGDGGADVFRFLAVTDSTAAATDYIADFSAAEGDKIDLSAITGGNASFGTGFGTGNSLYAFPQGGAYTVAQLYQGSTLQMQIVVNAASLAATDFVF